MYVRDVFDSFPAQAHEILTYMNNIHLNIDAFEAIWSVYGRCVFLHRVLEFDFKEGSFSTLFCSIWMVKACMLGPFSCIGWGNIEQTSSTRRPLSVYQLEGLPGSRKFENELGFQKCSKQLRN